MDVVACESRSLAIKHQLHVEQAGYMAGFQTLNYSRSLHKGACSMQFPAALKSSAIQMPTPLLAQDLHLKLCMMLVLSKFVLNKVVVGR